MRGRKEIEWRDRERERRRRRRRRRDIDDTARENWKGVNKKI